MNYNPRYKAFLSIGGKSNLEYIKFIARVKKLYLENREPFNVSDCIMNHNDFTKYIQDFCKGFIIANDDISDFLKRSF